MGRHIGRYKNIVESRSAEELSQLKLNSAGVYLGGECYLHNLIVTYKLNRGVMPSNEYLEDNCLNMLIAGLDTTASTLSSMVTLIAKQQEAQDGELVTQADCPFAIDTSLWRDLQEEQQRV